MGCSPSTLPWPATVCPGCGSGGRWCGCDLAAAVDRIHVSWTYAGAISTALRRAKLSRHIERGASLSALAAAHGPGDAFLTGLDQVVPVPPSPARLLRFGHDPATEMAAFLARALGVKLALGAVRRSFDSSQTVRGPGARRSAVASLYRPGGGMPGLQGARVLLVDDVRTTGATLAYVCRLIQEAGAREVRVWALAGSLDERRGADRGRCG